MANKKITQLPSIGGSLSPSAVLEIAQPNDETTGVSYRATAEQIANQASLWVPQTLTISGAPTTGIVGGGDLSTNRAFSFSFASIPGKTAPVVADSMLINNSGTSLPAQVTLDNFYKTIDGLNTLGIPSLTDDYLAIYHAADGLPYKLSPSALSIASGNVPAGGTTGQVLTKASDANYDTEWSSGSSGTVNPGTAGQMTWYAATGDAVSGNANANISNGAVTLGQAGSVIGQLKLAGNTSGTATITPQAAAGTPTITLPNASGTVAVSATAPLALDATTGALSISSAALTKTDDTNVTLTLGGSPSTALLAATSITAGWTGQLAPGRGGTGLSTYATGDIIYASAANTLSALSGNTAASIKYLSQTGTGSASQAPAWATISGGDITGAALTKVDDTNVTLTLGGTPTTALLQAASITAGWTGTLAVARGGTASGSASGTALDNITGFSSTGILARTGAGAYSFRTITGTTNVITVTDGDGVSGNPTLTVGSLVLRSDTSTTTTVGYLFTSYSGGTPTNGSTFTPAAANGNYQYITNNVAGFTIAVPAADSAIDLLITNGASAGTITFSGYTVSSNTGDALTTTNTSKFIISIRRINGVSTYVIKALQ